jgi:hypothetical protein
MKSTVVGVVVLGLLSTVDFPRSTQTTDKAREAVTQQIHHMAEQMRACPEEVRSQDNLGIYYIGPPTKLEWDVEKSETGRSPFQATITFLLPERSEESDKAKRSKKLHKQYEEGESYRTQYVHPGHYEYDFDLGNGAPDLIRVLFVDDKTKESKPVPNGGRDSTCWDKAARSETEAD